MQKDENHEPTSREYRKAQQVASAPVGEDKNS